jgi:prophage DNA circulation protein
MALSEQLRPASFRGVPFEVDVGEIEAGRRVELHKYPKRDKSLPEDLGRDAREISVQAFMVGADYVERANRLLAAAEEPGPGTLVHPWLGSMRVTLINKVRVTFDKNLGLARVQLSFVEAGELTFPTADSSTQSQSRLAAQGVEDAAAKSFASTFTIDGQPDFVGDAASSELGSVFGTITGAMGQTGTQVKGYVNTASSALSRARGLMSNPLGLAHVVLDYLRLSDLSGGVQQWSDIARSVLRLLDSAGLQPFGLASFTTPTRATVNANSQAVRALMRQGLIAQAVGASSFVGSSADSSKTMAYDDQLATRNNLIAAIDNEALQLTTDDDAFDALQAARSRVWGDMTTRSRDSARLTSITPLGAMPALVLAYDLYEDAGRDTEIVNRNRVTHPGFVPPRPLRVLTR